MNVQDTVVPQQMPPAENPNGKVPPGQIKRERAPGRQQAEVAPAQPAAQLPGQAERERFNAKPDKQKNQQTEKEKNGPKGKRNGRDENGTNTIDNAGQG